MSDNRVPRRGERVEVPPTVEEIARLDEFLDYLVDDRRPPARPLTEVEVAERVLAAQLRLALDGVEEPTAEFLRGLEEKVERQVAREQQPRRLPAVNRSRFMSAALRTAAAVGLAGAGVGAGMEAGSLRNQPPKPGDLVEGPGRWYDVAGADELASGGMKAFAAGGVMGYLVNDGGRLHAVSSICTHMGCMLKADAGSKALRCLCHGSWFRIDGSVGAGMAPDPLPRIDIRVAGGRVYARGTVEDV